ncbi:MAG: GtrA family protein [Oscillospiraceae bacterium]|nr:GtrA family protein [Oscillospiraceae bacterium]
MFKKYRELILYIIIGVLTTAVNYAIYFTLTAIGVYYIAAQVISVAVSILFAFVTNKIYVFQDKRAAPLVIFAQLATFSGFRLISGAAETLILYVFVDFLYFNDSIVKILASIFVVAVNYVFSKFIIFRKKKV